MATIDALIGAVNAADNGATPPVLTGTSIGALLGDANVKPSLPPTGIDAAFLPSNTAMAATANQPTIRYLTSRPIQLVDTLNLHLDTTANNVITTASISANSGFEASAAFTGADSATTGTTTSGTGSLTVGGTEFIVSTLSQAWVNTAANAAPAFAFYDSGFMIIDAQKDTDLLVNVDNTLVDVVTAFAGSYTGSYINVGKILDLAAAVGIDKLQLDQTYGGQWLTAFLPSDTAFQALGTATEEFVLWNREVAQMILANHVVNGTMGYYSEDVVRVAAVSLDTVGKTMGDASEATIDIAANTNAEIIFTDNAASNAKAGVTATVVNSDLYTKNVVVHEINTVLTTNAQDAVVTAALARTNLNETITPASEIETLLMAASPLVREAVNNIDYSKKTLLKPTDAAITALGQPTFNYLADPANQEDLNMVLMAHLLNGTVWKDVDVTVKDASDANTVCTMGVCVSSNADSTLDTATLGAPLYSAMGVSYDIDTVIVPAAVKTKIDEYLASSSSESSSEESSSDSAASVLAISGVATAACAFLLALF